MNGEDSLLRVRPMVPTDLDWVASAEAQVQSFPWSEKAFADSLEAGHGAWMLEAQAENGDWQSAGFALVMRVVDEAHLLNIAVAPRVQGQGLGGFLLRHLCNLFGEAGMDSMLLEVRVSNERAFNFYHREGFVEIGRRRRYYPAAHGREDAIVMRRLLQGREAA